MVDVTTPKAKFDALMQGLANLVLDDKANHLFGDRDSRTFVMRTLPKVLHGMYPDKASIQSSMGGLLERNP